MVNALNAANFIIDHIYGQSFVYSHGYCTSLLLTNEFWVDSGYAGQTDTQTKS